LRHLLESEPEPARIVLTVQEEVANRIVQVPPRMSLLALSVQVYGSPKIVGRIPAQAFFPVPKIDSAVIRIDRYAIPLVPAAEGDRFFAIARAGFGQKRKMLRNSLASGLRISQAEAMTLLQDAGIEPTRRAETLGIGEWLRLCRPGRTKST
jgi:16S rRNA (adenine1518-N6/adenine1519-N6)-dimethyltransferase